MTDLESTVELLKRSRAGDSAALERLYARVMPPLRRWARGRLPTYARADMDTQDLVMDTMTMALQRIDSFEPRHEGALQAYLRQAVLNRIRNQARKIQRRSTEGYDYTTSPAAPENPLDLAIGRDGVERYEAALQRLRPADREAIVGRLELQYDYEELAVVMNKPSANAARVAVTRALARLLEAMDEE